MPAGTRFVSAAYVGSVQRLRRFAAAVAPLAPVDCAELTAWIAAIPLEDWPQQNRLPDGKLRPAMVNDTEWMGFGERRLEVTGRLMAPFATHARDHNPMLSVVMPGAAIEPHRDLQPPDWLVRVHVPLLTNPKAWFISGGEWFHMEVGMAYMVNPEALHEIRNDGDTPRVHYMFDVRRA